MGIERCSRRPGAWSCASTSTTWCTTADSSAFTSVSTTCRCRRCTAPPPTSRGDSPPALKHLVHGLRRRPAPLREPPGDEAEKRPRHRVHLSLEQPGVPGRPPRGSARQLVAHHVRENRERLLPNPGIRAVHHRRQRETALRPDISPAVVARMFGVGAAGPLLGFFGYAYLGMSLVAVLTLWYGGTFLVAATVVWAVYLGGATVVHLTQFGHPSAGGVVEIVASHGLIAVLLVTALIVSGAGRRT